MAAAPSEQFSSYAERDDGSPARFSPVPYGGIGDRGGYDCEFVEPPPAAFQTDCPVCLHILREPCVISCPCGQNICRECVEQIKRDDKPCPLCNKTDFTYLRDYGLERSLGEFEVWCSHKKEGCIWTGKLGEYKQHLSQNPFPENKLTGCQFEAIECEHGCGEWFQRRHIASHQKGVCHKRPFACEYCHEYKSTFTDVTEKHYLDCEFYPVTCPNKCRKDPFKKQDIEKHIEDECPLTEIDCPLHYAGCEVRLPRKDMPEHMTDTVTHLTLLATVTQSLLKENQEVRQTTEDLKKDNQELRQTTEDLKKENQELRQTTEDLKKENQELRQTTEDLKRENQELRHTAEKRNSTVDTLTKENQTLGQKMNEREFKMSAVNQSLQAHKSEIQNLKDEVQKLKFHKLGLPCDFRIEDKDGDVFLPGFYTHSSGYRMCIRVVPRGLDEGRGTHMSLFVYLQKGQFDDHLKWPFRGEIAIQIVNQAGDHDHFENSIIYNDATVKDCCNRVVDGKRSQGWGYDQFFPRSDLQYNPKKNTQYLKNDIIIVRLAKVTLL